MVKFELSNEIKYFTPFTMYMEYILLNYNNFLKKHLEDEKLTTKEFLYLFDIFWNNGISQKELSDLMYVSEANVTKMVKKLDAKGYIDRKKDENNKSRNILCLTKKGELVVYRFVDLTIKWETKVLNKHHVKDMDEFKDLLYELSENSVDVE